MVEHSGFAGGTGTAEDPYLISTPEQLFNIRYVLLEGEPIWCELIEDIDLKDFIIPEYHPESTIEREFSEGDFPPIWYFNDPDYWEGVSIIFEGNNHSIKNLQQTPHADNISEGFFDFEGGIGLFNYAYQVDFEVRNLFFENVNIVTSGLDAALENATNSKPVGALIGELSAWMAKVENVHAEGYVEFKFINDRTDRTAGAAGGIFGEAGGARINRCSFRGTVVAGESAGGIVGQGAPKINNCFCRATLITEKVADEPEFRGNTAGILGYGWGWDPDEHLISNCYFDGVLKGRWVNPIVGSIDEECVENNYYNSDDYPEDFFIREGYELLNEGEIGLPEADLKFPYNENTAYINWNIGEVK